MRQINPKSFNLIKVDDSGRRNIVDNTRGMLGYVSQKNTEILSLSIYIYIFHTIKAYLYGDRLGWPPYKSVFS